MALEEKVNQQAATEGLQPPETTSVAYFCMEIGIEASIPTYSGGLGALAGDTLRAAADLNVPIAAVTLLYREGYFRQHLDEHGNQSESPYPWDPERFLELMPARVSVMIEGREVQVRAWRYLLKGASGQRIPVYFLDTFLPENSPADQTITDRLYGGDQRYRLCQEIVLGLGGLRMLRALGHSRIQVYHMNEGHSALLTLGLLKEHQGTRRTAASISLAQEEVRKQCIFTTHTPVEAGHDKFPLELVKQVLDREHLALWQATEGRKAEVLNMTRLAMHFSRYINGVSDRHCQVTREMFPEHDIRYVTNGVHAASWASPYFQELFNQHIPGWRRDNQQLRRAINIPRNEIKAAHRKAKERFLEEIERRCGRRLDPDVFTIGFARRATSYKRPDLLFSDVENLRRIARERGPLQVIYGGKAHPRDEAGKKQISSVYQAAATLHDVLPVVYLEEYDIALAKLFVAGVDLWLNNPLKPLEASGTSGMKAALNGVPSLSVLDGWWIEGHIEGVTGWAIGNGEEQGPEADFISLYSKLEEAILPLFYQQPEGYAGVMANAIALNGSFFNTQRMMSHYLSEAYCLAG